MDSDTPNLIETQKICKQYNAFLLIDCAHDFGCMGTGSKCLSTNIGFVGCDDPKVIEYLKYYSTAYMFTNAINPVQAATSLANLSILRS
jgi:glycine C-acetyltransferase